MTHSDQSRGPLDSRGIRSKRQANHMAAGWQSRGYLPHEINSQRTQHVTIHLADSLPKSAIDKIDAEIGHLIEGEKEIERRKRVHQWIDAGYGECLLANQHCAQLVQNTLTYFHDQRYQLHAWVVMPNHAHVLFTPRSPYDMKGTVSSWKKFSGRRIAEWARKQGLSTAVNGIASASDSLGIWHRECWDRYIRDERHFRQTVAYIENNPVAAGLCKTPQSWPWSSAAL